MRNKKPETIFNYGFSKVTEGLRLANFFRNNNIDLCKTELNILNQLLYKNLSNFIETKSIYQYQCKRILNKLNQKPITYQQYIILYLQLSYLISEENPYTKFEPNKLIGDSINNFEDQELLDKILDPVLLKHATPYIFNVKNGILGIETLVKFFIYNIIPLPVARDSLIVHGKKADILSHIMHDLYHGEVYFPNFMHNNVEIKMFKKMHSTFNVFFKKIQTYSGDLYLTLIFLIFFMIHEQNIEYSLMNSKETIVEYSLENVKKRIEQYKSKENKYTYYKKQLENVLNISNNFFKEEVVIYPNEIENIIKLKVREKFVKILNCDYSIVITKENEIDFFFKLLKSNIVLYESAFPDYFAEDLNSKPLTNILLNLIPSLSIKNKNSLSTIDIFNSIYELIYDNKNFLLSE